MSERAEIEGACRSCHRLEIWIGGVAAEVRTEGGLRLPAVHPQRAAFAQVTSWLRGEPSRVVGTCSACGQPLVASASADLPGVGWQITLPVGTISVAADGTMQGPCGPVSLLEADELIERSYPSGWSWRTWRTWRPLEAAFRGTVLTLMLGPVIALLIAIASLSIFFQALAGQLVGGP